MNDAATAALDPVSRARALGPAIAAASDAIERDQVIPEPLLTQILDARLPRMLLPRSAGGDEIAPWIYCQAVEEVSRHDASLGWNLFVANSATLIAPFIPLGAARAIWDDPRGWIAWGPPDEQTCDAVPGGYRVSGVWHFASGSRQATWMGMHGHVREKNGSSRLNRHGRPTLKTLLFPRSQATPIHDWDTIGLRGTASESYRLDNVFVPEEFTGTREDPSLRRDPGPLYAFTMQGLYTVGVAGVALGLARAMLDAFVALAKGKVPRGLPRLADMPVVQSNIAHREAELGAARTWLAETLKDVYARADDTAPIGLDDRLRVRLSCAHAIEAAVETSDYAYHAAGITAIAKGSAWERRFRDMRTLSQQIQARDAHFEIVGRIMLNGDPDGMFL